MSELNLKKEKDKEDKCIGLNMNWNLVYRSHLQVVLLGKSFIVSEPNLFREKLGDNK